MILLLPIKTSRLLLNEHISSNDHYLSVLVPCALVFKMIILQPMRQKQKKTFIFIMTSQWDLRDHAFEALRYVLWSIT